MKIDYLFNAELVQLCPTSLEDIPEQAPTEYPPDLWTPDAPKVIEALEPEHGKAALQFTRANHYHTQHWRAAQIDYAEALLVAAYRAKADHVWPEFLREIEAFKVAAQSVLDLCESRARLDDCFLASECLRDLTEAKLVHINGLPFYYWQDAQRVEEKALAYKTRQGLWIEFEFTACES